MGNHQLRMGREMPFTSSDGAIHPASFWCLDSLRVEIGAGNLILGFIGYHDAASYDADRAPIGGAIKYFQVRGDDFSTALSSPSQLPSSAPLSAIILHAAWQIALSQKTEGEPPQTGEEDERVSFFASATAPGSEE